MAIRFLPWLMLPVLASCVAPSRAPAPAPTPSPAASAPTPAPASAPAAERFAGDWSAAPLAPGEWQHQGGNGRSVATFGAPQGALVELSCASGTITLARAASTAPSGAAYLNVRSSFAERRLPVPQLDAAARRLRAQLPAADPLWDQIIYSRGRFVIEAPGHAPLVIPTRPEVARVIEDCRG